MDAVVLPLDDSLAPPRALRAAFSVARRASSEVLLVSARPPEEAHDAALKISAAAERFSAVAPFVTEILDEPPVDEILARAAAANGMICLPTHGRAGVSRLVFGSVAEDLIKRSTVPVLCLGPHFTDVFLPAEKIEGLVCTDGSAVTDTVLRRAADFARMVTATCVVAQVVGPDEDVALDGEAPPQPVSQQADRHCRESAERLGAEGVEATYKVLPGQAADSIVQYARRRGSGFIVVGTAGRSGLARMAIGSVAAAVVREAPCPVLVVPTADRTEHPRPS